MKRRRWKKIKEDSEALEKKMRLVALITMFKTLSPNQPLNDLFMNMARRYVGYPNIDQQIEILEQTVGGLLSLAHGQMHDEMIKAFREAKRI